jgi:hypothetical protein
MYVLSFFYYLELVLLLGDLPLCLLIAIVEVTDVEVRCISFAFYKFKWVAGEAADSLI